MQRSMHFAAFMLIQLGVGATFLISQSSTIPNTCPETTNFVCDSNRCIPISKRCDGHLDCMDTSDEMECDIYLCQEPHWFRCHNRLCVSHSFVCDDENDCGDSSDEQNCTAIQVSSPRVHDYNCSANEWKCTDSLCILTEWVCNGEPDCLDGSDETRGCTEQITSCKEFKCKNGECISKQWRCDGAIDCKDGSDEQNCNSSIATEKCKLDEGFLLCNKNCVKLSEFCDGTVKCPGISIRTEYCNVINTCNILKCTHDCITTPSGSKCLCPTGYNVTNVVNCTDVNECEIYGICDQKCLNLQGSYECYCDRGYTLQKDKRTCKVSEPEGVMVFSSKTEIRGYYLESELYFPIAKYLKHAIGVAYDGNHVYWTEIFSENESIVKALEDGTHREILVTSGIGTPEDLAIDWITGNIYFTDNEMQHIGVCTNDGMYCTVLVNQGVHKPRGIVLNSLDGEMYWSDWGKRPEIARSKMDGSEDISFVANEIYWPNGLALDRPNSRLYWTDAKSMTLESIKLDGSDRHIILEGIVKHPYALDVFENRIYWSDWESRTIESCDKFTGKNHHILIKQKGDYVYGLHIFHSVLQPHSKNPCKLAFCSNICLLSGPSYSCACPENTVLGTDKHTCRATAKEQLLVFGTNRMLWKMHFQQLGKHSITPLPIAVQNISALAFNDLNNMLFISDISSHSIITLDLYTGDINQLINDNSIDHIAAMDFDNLGNNLYWCDSGKGVVEVLNLNTLSRKVLLSDMVLETPVDIALIPEEGIMFVAFETSLLTSHIDRLHLDGSNRTHVIDKGLLGPLRLIYDSQLHRIFWTDFGTGNIESTSTDGDDRHGFRSLQNSPLDIASLNKNIFWINHNMQRIYWAEKMNNGEGYNKKITVDVPKNAEIRHLISITPREVQHHPCEQNNGNCSHLCLVAVNTAICTCPLGMKLQADKTTCFKPKSCELNEYFCKESNICVPWEMHCNHHKDCAFGEDEKECEIKNECGDGFFQCRNKECIKKDLACDMNYNCKDKSDEENCHTPTACASNHFMCPDGFCIENRFLCDGQRNCRDGSDEEVNCGNSTCNSGQFRCSSGSCIPKSWECDQELDCTDHSDEHKQCGYVICKSPKFLCKNGLCIDDSLKCNKIDDCGDSSDEASSVCGDTISATNCGFNEYRCYQNDSLCVPMSARCNGTSECPQHEDEQGCTDCQIDEFECNNKRCIPTQWLCDHVDDCGDDSDENLKFCLHEQNSLTTNINHSCENKYRCKSGQCIDTALVCNNEDNCSDGSDEYGACFTSCLADNNPCSHICVRTPAGPQCHCSAGYKLRGDSRTCTDIQECSFDPPVCSQLCAETSGSYKCSCYTGYVLRSDGISCKSIGEAMSLVFGTSNEIYQLSQANSTLRILYSGETSKITSIDVSIQHGYVYFSTEESGTLHRIQMQKQIREYINNVGHPQNLALDWISENIYYVNNDPTQKSIRLCNFEAQYCAKILDIDINSNVSALSVDAINEYLFYSVSKWQIFNSYGSVIYKCNLDGSQVQQIMQSSSSYVTDLAYNLHSQTLYYMDHNIGHIHKIQYDGTNQAKIVTNLAKPMTLTVFDDHLYFYSPNGYMTLCPLYKDYQACKSYKLNGSFNDLFVIYHSSRQPAATNICQNHTCTHVCVRKNNSVECICNLEKVNAEQLRCQHKQITTVSYTKLNSVEDLDEKLEELNKNSSNAVLVAVIIALFIIAGVLGIYYYFHKRHSQNFNISMRFQNPVYGFLQDSSQEIILQPGQHEYYNPMDFSVEKLQAPPTEQFNEKLVP